MKPSKSFASSLEIEWARLQEVTQSPRMKNFMHMIFPSFVFGHSFPRPSVGQALERFKPDIIHVVNPAVLGLGGIYFAKTMNIPLVASYHTHLPQYLQHYGLGSLEGLLWELLKLAHNQASLNLCTSTAMVQELN